MPGLFIWKNLEEEKKTAPLTEEQWANESGGTKVLQGNADKKEQSQYTETRDAVLSLRGLPSPRPLS